MVSAEKKKIGKYWVRIAFWFLVLLGLLYNIINDNRKLTIVESLIKRYRSLLFQKKCLCSKLSLFQQQINEYREKEK